jgi:2-polyprenyl-3-methyl-5-hydroxy-6-metoxy-1,4-benzoquinol methylase
MNKFISNKYADKDNEYTCPLCSKSVNIVSYIFIKDDHEHKIYSCKSCGFMFIKPIIIEDITYRQMNYVIPDELYNNNLLKKLNEKLVINKEINNTRKYIGQGQRSLLDIGCGTGWITSIWNKNGFQTTGIEPSKARAEVARQKYGLTIIEGYLEHLNLNQKFDVILLRHIVEHFEDPVKMLKMLKSLLNTKGVIVMVVPNINCLGRYIFDTSWEWGLPYHCNFFNPKTLNKLSKESGLKVLKSYQTISPLFYPGSLFKMLPNNIRFKYNNLKTYSLLPFSPFILLGYIFGLSENITSISQINPDSS